MSVPPPALGEALAAVLDDVLGPASVSGLRRLSGGASRETWAFEARPLAGAAAPRRLVLRRDPPGAPAAGLALEARLLEAAAAAGVPVPPVVASGPAGGPLATAWVVMEHVEGETLPRRVLRLVADRAMGEELASQCGRILAAVHGIAPASVPGLPGGDQLEQLRGILDLLGEPHPALELGLRRLAATRPPRPAEVVVHGDFRTGNLIVGPEGVRAVLDWEIAHRGDPLEDLGWLCAPAWRFGSPLPVGGFGSLGALVRSYQEASGARVEPEALRWWQALASLRWGVFCILQAHTHLSGALRSVELAAIGRRTCEAEWDLLGLLP
jgi:aminoglycoside phosphotransferase (APT) family kinase protein